MASSTYADSSILIGGPVPGASRQGRHKQRYGEAGERLLAGCIPVRFLDCSQSAHHVQVCMITTASGNGLVFPKGGWEDDESVESAAQRETVEEAGVRGVLEEPLLGVFPFASAKHAACSEAPNGSGAKANGLRLIGADSGGVLGSVGSGGSAGSGGSVGSGGRCKAFIYVMHVAEELPAWPESKDRRRVWCSLWEASRRCKHQWMREALQTWVRRRGWDVELEAQPPPQTGHQQLQGPAETPGAATLRATANEDLDIAANAAKKSLTASAAPAAGSGCERGA